MPTNTLRMLGLRLVEQRNHRRRIVGGLRYSHPSPARSPRRRPELMSEINVARLSLSWIVRPSAAHHTGNPGIERTLTVTVERPMSWRNGQDLWIGRVGRRYRLISRSAGKVWLCQIRREGSSG